MRISDWSSDVCSSYLYLSSSPLASASQSIANASRDRLEETISIATLDPSDLGQIIYIARAERNQIIAAPLMVGSTLPSHCRSEEHTSELQSLMRISYAVFCLKKKTPSLTTLVILLNISLITNLQKL